MLTDADRRAITAAADRLDSLDTADGAASARDIRAILARPATVADLLPRVDATHPIMEWQVVDGIARARARFVGGIIKIEWLDTGLWEPGFLTPSDLTQPATLVEVTDGR